MADWNTLTRALVGTSQTGAQNIATVTGDPFATVVSRWVLANYVTDRGGALETDPAWSPDGQLIAFRAIRLGGRCNRIRVVHPDGSGQRALTSCHRHNSIPARSPYGAKNPKTSRINCAGLLGDALMEPLVVGTMARLEVTAPSPAFKVETSG